MSLFDLAWPVLLEHEGGWTIDDGGPTNMGWTLPALAKVGMPMTADELHDLSLGVASMLARQNYWNGFGSVIDQTVGTKMLDMAFNMEDPAVDRAKGEAVTLLQRALCDCGSQVAIDGVWGPQTFEAANEFPGTRSIPIWWSPQAPARDTVVPHDLITALVNRQAGFYRSLAAADPSKYGPYLDGWLKRAAWPFKETPS